MSAPSPTTSPDRTLALAIREGVVRFEARAVGAHDFIKRLAQGYDTVLDPRGSNLSLALHGSESPSRSVQNEFHCNSAMSCRAKTSGRSG